MDGTAGQIPRNPRKKNATLSEELREARLEIAIIKSDLRTRGERKPPQRNRPAEGRIAQWIDETYSESELIELCYDINLDWEGIEGRSKGVKALQIVLHLARRGLLEVLISQLERERPNVPWYSALLGTGEGLDV